VTSIYNREQVLWEKPFQKVVESATLVQPELQYGKVVLVSKSWIIKKAKSEGRTILTEIESKELLKETGISVNDTKLATSKEEALSMSRQFGLPVVLKIASSGIVHKSDTGEGILKEKLE